MANVVCLECKSEVLAGSDNCPECGFPFDSVNPTKCPECGNEVVFTSGSCPECGFPVEALDEILKERVQPPHLQVVHPAPADGVSMQQLYDTPADAEVLKGQLATLNELMVNISSFVDDSRKSNSSMLNDLYGGIEKFLEDAEKIKSGMSEAVTEQNAKATAAMQEMVSYFSEEMKAVVEDVKSAKDSAVGAINSAAEQAKTELSAVGTELQAKLGSTVDYIFYISLAMVFFAALNIAISAYVVKVVKEAESDHAPVQIEQKQHPVKGSGH